jgi:hypothetical protein
MPLRPPVHRVAVLLLALVTVPVSAAAPRPVGPELPLAEQGGLPSLAVAADGSFTASWVGPGARERSAWVRRFTPAGTPLAPAFRAGDARYRGFRLTFAEDHPVVAGDADGAFVVAWTDCMGPTAKDLAVFARRFGADGQPRGVAFRVSAPGAAAATPRAAMAADGSFVLGWTVDAGEPGHADAWVRRYRPDGTPEGPARRVNEATLHHQELGDLALAPDGALGLLYEDSAGEGVGYRLLFSLFAADGSPAVRDLVVGAGHRTELGSRLVRLADGRWLAAWIDDPSGEVAGRTLAADGGSSGPRRSLHPRSSYPGDSTPPLVAPIPGGALVVWTDRSGADGNGSAAMGRAVDAELTPLAEPFVLPLTTFGDQWGAALAVGPHGDAVAAWFDPQAPLLRARRLAAPCAGDARSLCLHGTRFRVEAWWQDFAGRRGGGAAVPRGEAWGTFWFFAPANTELGVKVLDGRRLNGCFWVFLGALSNVEHTVRVTDTATGRVATYRNPSGSFGSRGDALALAAPPDGGAGAAAPRRPDRLPASAGSAAGPAPPLLLRDGRFGVEVHWRDSRGRAGHGTGLRLSPDSGWFWFFAPHNPELVVKILDGRPLNGHFWVFFGALSDVAFTLRVTDRATGETAVYDSPLHHFASAGDTTAFPRPAGLPDP